MAAAVTLTIFLLIRGCVAKLISTPRNTVGTLQHETPTVLSCKTDKSGTAITWSFGDNTNVIFNGYDIKEKYPVFMNLDAGECNLTLRSLDASYAGRYICVEPGSTQRASAQLTVIESDPQCSTNLSSTDNVRVNEIYELSCKIIYRGQLTPRITWYRYNDSHVTEVTAETREQRTEGQWMTFISSLNVAATSRIYYDATTTFQVALNRSLLQTATNDPHYRYTWTSPQLSIAPLEASNNGNVTIINIAMYVAGGVSVLLLLLLLIFIISVRLRITGCSRAADRHYPDLVYDVAAATREAENAARLRGNEVDDGDNEDDESVNAVDIEDDYIEPIDVVHPAADADDGRHGNDDVRQPQYAELMPTKRSERRRREPVCRRPYADVAQYAAIDHRIPAQTVVIVVNDP